MTQATEFKQAQAQAMRNRSQCWICSNHFDRKAGEMCYTYARVFIGYVGTQAQEINAHNFDKVEDKRKPLFTGKYYLVCKECDIKHRNYLDTHNIFADQREHSKRKKSDLLWDEA